VLCRQRPTTAEREHGAGEPRYHAGLTPWDRTEASKQGGHRHARREQEERPDAIVTESDNGISQDIEFRIACVDLGDGVWRVVSHLMPRNPTQNEVCASCSGLQGSNSVYIDAARKSFAIVTESFGQ